MKPMIEVKNFRKLALYLFSWDNRNAARRGHPLLALLALIPFLAGIFLL